MIDLRLGDCLEILPTLGVIDAIITDPPYLTGNSRVPIRGKGVAERIEDTESVGLPWGYNLDWVDAAAALEPKHWVVFAHFKMLGGLCSALERHAEISAVFAWRKSNAPRMADRKSTRLN